MAPDGSTDHHGCGERSSEEWPQHGQRFWVMDLGPLDLSHFFDLALEIPIILWHPKKHPNIPLG